VLAQRAIPEETPKEASVEYIRIFVEKVRNVFVMGEAFRFDETRRAWSSRVIF